MGFRSLSAVFSYCLGLSGKVNMVLPATYNVYCDESCHLENDGHPVMVLGVLWCSTERSRSIAERIREIKVKHRLNPRFEMKWSKVSPSGSEFYRDVIDYFFDEADLHFRGLVAHKEGLRHEMFKQSHDEWYSKMYYLALHTIFFPKSSYRIYLDLKDTRSGARNRLLHEILCNKLHDFGRHSIRSIQAVQSHDVEQIQLADLLIGAVGYANRNIFTSSAKTALVQRIQKRSGYSLLDSTLLREDKFNIFHWTPQGAE